MPASAGTSPAGAERGHREHFGAGRCLGVEAAVGEDSLAALRPVLAALGPFGASVLVRRDGELCADIAPLHAAGVPGYRHDARWHPEHGARRA